METKPTLTVNLEHLQQVLADGDFCNTETIKELVISESITEIDYELREFINMCVYLEGFSVHPDNPVFSSEFGVLFNKDKTELLICPRGLDGHYEIPNHVTKIRRGAFDACTSLISVTIPNSVSVIEDGTFNDCIRLSEVYIPDSVTEIGEYAFGGCFDLWSIYIPESVTKIADNAFSGSVRLEKKPPFELTPTQKKVVAWSKVMNEEFMKRMEGAEEEL